MRPERVRVVLSVAACLAGLSLIAGTSGASAEPRHGGPAAARPAAPAMARPAAPAFHPAPQRPAMAARPMPHFAAPSRPAPPHFAVSRPSFQRPAMASRPARPAPHIAAAPHPNARSTISARSPRHERQPREERIAQPARGHELRTQQHQQLAQQRQRDALSRRSTERQTRIDRLQQRVQQLQAEKPQGRRAQRALAAQQRLLQREQLSQKRDLAQQQKLGIAPATAQHSAAANAVQAAARGRFAARFRNNADPRAQLALAARLNGWAPRKAWRHHVHAAFVPWLGPVFWPYAYADIFDYTFWPAAYDDAYWAYAYDDLIDTAFWDVGSPYSAYASIDPEGNVVSDGYIEPGSATVGSSRLRERSGLSQRDLRQLCRNPDSGITAWPFAEITRTLRPTSDQRALLDQLKQAAAQAAGALKNSCSDSYALTPPDRLRAMTSRISATLDAVRMVRPALEAFYNALDDEQRARFNALGPRLPAAPEDQPQQEAKAGGKADSCNASKSSLTNLPIERIKAVLHPTDTQQNALDHLSDATKQAVKNLQAACPDEVPVTPVGRLEAMEKRLSAMLQAANQMQPALDDFYASLTIEQKARFNTLQQIATQ
ncbi:MAG: Spy/CpxP family protein refolding chaperone [Bradyrhizobium sp.]|nr:Spy/CpxP family protein refolding chaperone [Bradyrhizobium sp.]